MLTASNIRLVRAQRPFTISGNRKLPPTAGMAYLCSLCSPALD